VSSSILTAIAWAMFRAPQAMSSIDGRTRTADDLKYSSWPQSFEGYDATELAVGDEGVELQTVVAIDRDTGYAAVFHGEHEPYLVIEPGNHFKALMSMRVLPGYDEVPWEDAAFIEPCDGRVVSESLADEQKGCDRRTVSAGAVS